MTEQTERQAQQRNVYQMQFLINLFIRVFYLLIKPNCGMYVGLKINFMNKTKNRYFILSELFGLGL